MNEIERLSREVKVLRRVILALCVLPCALAVLAFQNPVRTIKTEMIELTDSSGRVLTRLSPGSISLLNKGGVVKTEITADDQNGNMTLRGAGEKRISMFMSDKVPLIVLYSDKGEPIASLPAAIR